jgi:hypothetical protein
MDEIPEIMEPRRWHKNGWKARVIKNEEDDGWAVEMTRDGDPEPALVGPWTMGRDKKNPKPLDMGAFTTLVKTASEVIRRHEHAAAARLHKGFTYTRKDNVRVRVEMDIQPDEDDPHARLLCYDDVTSEELYRGRVAPNFKLSAATVEREMSGRG